MLNEILFYTEKIFENVGIKKDWQYRSLNIVSLIGFLIGIVTSLSYLFEYSINDYFLLWIFRGVGIIVVGFTFLMFYFALGVCLDEIDNEDINLVELIGLLTFFMALFVISIALGNCIGIEGIVIIFLFWKLTKIKVRNIFLFLKRSAK